MEGANELIELGRELARLGFTWASSGNLSMRTGEGFTMTASGSRLPRLGENDLVTVDANGEPIAGAADARPSKEAGMHLAVYRRVAETNCVIHLSPPFTTFLACSQLALPAHAFPEVALRGTKCGSRSGASGLRSGRVGGGIHLGVLDQ